MKLVIGIITYKAAKYLPHFLPSLEAQIFKDFKVLILDNNEAEDSENKQFFENYKSKLDIDLEWAGENLGFAKGFNKLINKARDDKAEYFMMMNTDMMLEPDMIEKMIAAMDNDNNLGSASPKIKVWDFQNTSPPAPLLNRRGEQEVDGKTNLIDSCGVVVNPGLRFVDVGQGQEDRGQFDEVKILGPSGTAPIYRMGALEKIKTSPQPSPSQGEGDKSEYFDELMFMYKEDCDSAYRLFFGGFTSRLVSDAVCYHDRSVKGEGESNIQVAINRKNKSRQAKKWSFLNQQIIFVKYWRLQSFIGKLAIVWYQLKILVFILLFEQYLLLELSKLQKIRRNIKIY